MTTAYWVVVFAVVVVTCVYAWSHRHPYEWILADRYCPHKFVVAGLSLACVWFVLFVLATIMNQVGY